MLDQPQYVVTGGMQNVINVYDTAQGGGIPGTQFNKQEYNKACR